MPRRPKPTKLKILEGNPGKRPLNKLEPEPPMGDCPKPDWWEEKYNAKETSLIMREANLFFDRMKPRLEDMGVLTVSDEPMFELMCYYYGVWRNAQHQLLTRGFVYPSINKQGGEYLAINPYATVANKIFKDFLNIASRFGMTPSDRTSLVGKKSEADNAFAELISRGRALPGRV